MSMEHWWNDTDREKPKYLGKKPDIVPLGWYRTRTFAVGGWRTLKANINQNYA